ncbi:MAG: LysM peptidoglycan-binding domain-containing protein [Granulosicoccus sp.]
MKNKNSILTLGLLLTTITTIQGCSTTRATSQTKVPADVTVLQLRKSQEVAHTVGPRERLSDIALRYTGNASHWQEIAKYNRISDPHTISIGAIIKIPPTLLPQNNPALATRATQAGNGITTTSLAIQRQVTAPNAQHPDIPKIRTQGSVVIQTVPTNRSFHLTPTEKDASQTRTTQNRETAKVKIVGTYYPKGIYQHPANYSKLIMRAAPGSLFELEHLANDWYKVVTNEGIGYLREDDGIVVMGDRKL